MKTTKTARLETLDAMIYGDPFLEFEGPGAERDALRAEFGIVVGSVFAELVGGIESGSIRLCDMPGRR